MSFALLIVLGPLAAVPLSLLVRRWSALFAVIGAVVSLAAALAGLARVADGARYTGSLPGLPGLPLRLVLGPLGSVLATTVATVSVMVLVYAVGYMRRERDQARFYAAMAFFVAAMQTLVLAGDWVLFLAAWELIALASYLLIGFWFERPGVGGAATRAFLTTRAADIGLYLGVFCLIAAAGTAEIEPTLEVGGGAATVAGLAFLLASIGKSAQVPLQGWLQEAMAGPTPVSALLHSATLVVAGVVLLTRAYPLLSSEVRLVVGVVGASTLLVTGITAIAQHDLKRLLAASTSSQLGLMLLALGAGSIGAAILHLVANAAMKSALFLGAGDFQHARRSTSFADLAGVGRERRGAFAGVAVASLALAGIPPLAGFWSKDAVIAASLQAPGRLLLAPLALAGSALTGVYLGRMLRLLWRPDAGRLARGNGDAGDAWMGAGLASLVAIAVGFGLVVEPIAELLNVALPEETAALILGLVAAAVSLLVGWFVAVERLLGGAYRVALAGFPVAGGMDELVTRPALAVGHRLDGIDHRLHAGVLTVGRRALEIASVGRALDAGIHAVVEGVGAAGLAVAHASRQTDEAGIDAAIADLVASTRRLGVRARQLQTGLIHRELLVAVGGTAMVLLFVLLF